MNSAPHLPAEELADVAFRAYFHDARPNPWPWETATTVRVTPPIPTQQPHFIHRLRRASTERVSRRTLAASLAALLVGGFAMTPDVPRPNTTSSTPPVRANTLMATTDTQIMSIDQEPASSAVKRDRTTTTTRR